MKRPAALSWSDLEPGFIWVPGASAFIDGYQNPIVTNSALLGQQPSEVVGR